MKETTKVSYETRANTEFSTMNKRRPNFSEDEKMALLKEVVKRRKLALGKYGRIPRQVKTAEWDKVVRAVNSASTSGIRRNRDEVQKKFVDWKSLMKKELEHQRESGGAPSKLGPLSASDQGMMAYVAYIDSKKTSDNEQQDVEGSEKCPFPFPSFIQELIVSPDYVKEEMDGDSDFDDDDFVEYDGDSTTAGKNSSSESVVSDSVILQVLKTVAEGASGNVVIRIEKQGSPSSSQTGKMSTKLSKKNARLVKKSSKKPDNSDLNTTTSASDSGTTDVSNNASHAMHSDANVALNAADKSNVIDLNDDAQMYTQHDNTSACGYGNSVQHMQHNTLLPGTAGVSGRVVSYGEYQPPSAQDIAAASALENTGYIQQPEHSGAFGGHMDGGKTDTSKTKKPKAEVNEDVAVKMLEIQQQICNSVRGIEATLRDVASSQRQMVDIHRYIASKLEMAFQQKY